MINEFDKVVLELVNISSQRDQLIVQIASFVANDNLFKGVFLVTLLWLVWMKGAEKLSDKNFFMIKAIAGSFVAILIGRVAQNYLPMRLRPVHNPDINFIVPYGLPENVLGGFSSFPSDHAILFFALSTAIWTRNRSAGILAFAWSLVVISFPRIYLGFHYPSDIIVGALIGIGIMLLSLRAPLPSAAVNSLEWVQNRHAGWLYAGIFFFSLQMATLFESLRRLGSAGKVLLALIGAPV
ncbi:MAG TPA: phosphatase PAP2 family protein [Candidatus Limnocylindria bacterium]|nr:phosphatase PAP2 family protein [Candidatus Limnocylindria bacterium]